MKMTMRTAAKACSPLSREQPGSETTEQCGAAERESPSPPVQPTARTAASGCSDSRSLKRSASFATAESQAEDEITGTSDVVIGANTPKRARRKSTYSMRKEESELLLKEVEALEKRALMLRQRAEGHLTEKALLNTMLKETHRTQQLTFAVAQSAVSGFLHTDQANPLSTSICLSTDWTERRNTLIGMRDSKLQSAFEYVQARSKFLDPLKPHHSEERFETTSGDYCCARFDLTQFEGVQSVKQVFDTLMLYNLNIEISVSERLGHITVREDYDSIDQSISNSRLLSAECGVNIESHIVTFSKFYESHELSNGKPCGIVALDFVDEDELFPYSPTERVRKDVAQVVVLTPHVRKKSDGEEELVVVMARGKFLKLHSAEFEVSPLAVQGMRSSMCWGPVMVTTINELLHPEFFSPIAEGSNLCALSI